jgi:hypothetical protein
MIIVTGTRRSGTSMWMQILSAAGFPIIGEPFPLDWDEGLREANVHGFHESILRHGIYHRTNPSPHTGEYLKPGEHRHHAVKVFIPGLLRSELGFLHRVVATVRPWREYVSSLARLADLERRSKIAEGKSYDPPPEMPPALEWWDENFSLIRDMAIRGYACHVQSYDGVLERPESVVPEVLDWIGAKGVDASAAIAIVKPQTRTQRLDRAREPGDSLAPHVTEAFDEFYAWIHEGKALDARAIEGLNRLHLELMPAIAKNRERIAVARGVLAPREEQPDLGPFDLLDGEID